MSKRGDNIQIRAKQECCETKKCPTKKQIPISEETIVSTNKLGDILLEEGGDVKKKIKEKVRFLADGKPYFNKKVISKTLKNKRR